MTKLLQLYRLLFIITLALYIYLGKGIAYGYFAEFMMLLGLLLLVKERKQIPIITERAGKIMYLFLIINIFFLIRGFYNYGIVDTIRDSLVINYLLHFDWNCSGYVSKFNVRDFSICCKIYVSTNWF